MAANSIAKLAVIITGDASPLRVATQQAAQSVQSMASSMKGVGAVSFLGVSVGAAAVTAGVTAATAAVLAFGRAGIAASAQLEQLRIAFEVMTGSATTANALLADMRKLSLETPLEMMDVSQAGKTLMAMGEPTQAIIADLKMLGDVAAGTGQPLNELAQVFGQVMQAGRLTGNELRQFNERGVPLLTTLAAQMGVTKAKIREMVEDSQISSYHVVQAFESMTGAGGKFANMMERQTDTLIGQWNKFKENITILAATVMLPLAIAIKEILALINRFLEFFGGAAMKAYQTANEARVRAMRQREAAQKQAADAEAAAAKELKKHYDEVAKRGEDLMRRGKSLSDSLRTPFEVMRDSMREANELMQEGVLGPDMLARAVAKIGDEYEKATAHATELKNVTSSAGEALQRGSVAEFSARIKGTIEADKITTAIEKSRLVQTEILKATQEVGIKIDRAPTTRFKLVKGNL